MEPVATWTPEKVAAWLRGLDDSLQDYPFEGWELPGKYLLQLCPHSLEALTVWPLGHQELILQGVEQLRALSSGLQTQNLRSLTERLLEKTRAFQSLVQDHLWSAKPPANVLSKAVELVHAAHTLLFWLNRYLFSHLNDFSACQEIGELCGELGQALQEDIPAAEKESKVLRICSHVAGICHHILSYSPYELLEQRAVLECVQLDDPLGLEIHTTSNCLHFVTQVGTQVPTNSGLQILPGDEIVQVNEQVVTPPQALSSPHLRTPSLTPQSPRSPSEDIFAFNLTSDPSPGPSSAWTAIFKPPPGGSTSLDPEAHLPILPASPDTLPAGAAETQKPPEHPDESPVPGRKKSKGVATRLSRRRVSCRELGQPDCDGWLLLRKVASGFMGPRWRRCWFVLKGHTLYWYHQPQDEKAEGLINVSSYSLESGQDQKKKYVFQLTHDVYKPFIFAADTLADLSIVALRIKLDHINENPLAHSKWKLPLRPICPSTDCYSETEAEDPDDEAGSRSASPSPARAWSPRRGDTSPVTTPTQRSPRTSFGPLTDNSEGALEGMVRGLKQGGVSLLGQLQPLTHEQWRSSFMRRNQDPRLNERVHRVRALQSTLKAKLQELQALEEVLGDPELTGEKFRRWKEQNQELYSEGLGAWGVVRAESTSQVTASNSREQSSQPLPSDPEEHSHLCSLTPESNLQPPGL
ncbi:connector enhancer of kinase suppressor of ras 1 isoform X6 [Manis pentadactyla]|uniref:connector enhancer of kinase suppressor of ras 1 isoform X6 n=1 Tax=Manis pentadactyla TaxID=143292 RepID=UPI00255C4C13|nr:connector enhancer of kinase suppressor of ras 1 isoform X6 [Manis pentadactyla]